MPAVARTISITEHHDRFLSDQISAGRHSSTSEVVREALRRYEDDVIREQAHLDYLRRLGNEGEAEIAAGNSVFVPREKIGEFFDDILREAIGE